MKRYIYSSISNAFYPMELREAYETAGTWPQDGKEVNDTSFQEFNGIAPEGKMRAAGQDGFPCWVDIPPLTTEELILNAEMEKKMYIDAANAHINEKQWPSKLALGRLTDSEKIIFNLWLDYIDELEAVDTNLAPEINWPSQPV